MMLALADNFEAEALSVQRHPPPTQGTALGWGAEIYRAPPLKPVGTRAREWELRQYWHNPYNFLFKAAANGLVLRVQSTPWEISAPNADRWQSILMQADFGDWNRFIAKLVKDYLRHDAGAWIELIAPGDPRHGPDGPIVGIAALDSLRVFPTGNPTYPAIYYDFYGKLHLMHRSRAVQFVSSEESEESLRGYGEGALSRCIAPVRRDILINQYIETFLDDKPQPGVRIWHNLGEAQVQAAFRKLENQNLTDLRAEWGRTIDLYGLAAETAPDMKFYANVKAPEGFDLEKYKTLGAREMAAGLGLDIQDFWELSGQGIGTGAQSTIIAQKSRGKAFGQILKGIERIMNQALPDDAEFRFKAKDPQQDQETADNASTWVTTIQTAANQLDKNEQRQLLANQVPAFEDVLLDAKGELIRLPDDDPKAPGQTANPATLSDSNPAAALVQNLTGQLPSAPLNPAQLLVQNLTQRAFTGTVLDFTKYFSSFVRVGQANSFTPAIMRVTFRDELMQAGTQAYNDGLLDGGADPADADAVTQADRRRVIAEWMSAQTPFINSLVDDVNSGTLTPETAKSRADLWVNKSIRAMYYAGLHDADSEQRQMWTLGATEKHCKSCLLLNGQVHTLKEWIRSGLYPGCSQLECQGFKCDCGMTKTDLPKRGRLPGAASPFAPLDSISAFLARLTRREHGEDLHQHAPDVWDGWLMRYTEAG